MDGNVFLIVDEGGVVLSFLVEQDFFFVLFQPSFANYI